MALWIAWIAFVYVFALVVGFALRDNNLSIAKVKRRWLRRALCVIYLPLAVPWLILFSIAHECAHGEIADAFRKMRETWNQ